MVLLLLGAQTVAPALVQKDHESGPGWWFALSAGFFLLAYLVARIRI